MNMIKVETRNKEGLLAVWVLLLNKLILSFNVAKDFIWWNEDSDYRYNQVFGVVYVCDNEKETGRRFRSVSLYVLPLKISLSWFVREGGKETNAPS